MQDLMMPSLKGLRGISYGIPGHSPFPELDKVVARRLKQLPIKVHNIKDCQSGDTKPVDGVLQLKVLAAGNNLTLVELTLTQWSQLSRDLISTPEQSPMPIGITHKMPPSMMWQARWSISLFSIISR
ncbi:MAG: hypothetical protein R3C24_19720 [Cyanobacteriota/Melainabacteria group bacterium]